jgi:hypothetical protein
MRLVFVVMDIGVSVVVVALPGAAFAVVAAVGFVWPAAFAVGDGAAVTEADAVGVTEAVGEMVGCGVKDPSESAEVCQRIGAAMSGGTITVMTPIAAARHTPNTHRTFRSRRWDWMPSAEAPTEPTSSAEAPSENELDISDATVKYFG